MKRSSNRSVATRLRALLLTLGLVLVGVVGVASPASADMGICSSYVGCVNSGHGDHGYGANSANSYWTMYPGHNCTNYAAFMAIKNGASYPSVNLGSADTWDTRAASYGVPVNGTPAVGAIAQWDAMHVAYVEAVNADGSITVSEDGYLGDYHWRVITRSGDWPDHFIHFADVVSSGGGEMLWKLRNSNSAGPATAAFYYGPDTAKPVTGDWDGNGSVTIGIARRDAASDQLIWKLRNSNSAGAADVSFYYGASSAIPVTGDWDGNGTTTVGTARKDDGTGELLWQLRDANSGGSATYAFHYGGSFDAPVVGDWDGNGTTTIGIARG